MNTNSVSIRKMKHTAYEVMAQWLSTKEVLEFYGDVNSPFTLQQVKDKYEPRVNGDIPVISYTVELDGSPMDLCNNIY
jgi:aminoglycoside 6'-N-acetyltransferase